MKCHKRLPAFKNRLCQPEVQLLLNVWDILHCSKLDCDHEHTFYF